MALSIVTIKKRSTFVYVRDNGKFIRSKSFNIQILQDNKLKGRIDVGFTATKRLGNAVIRNKEGYMVNGNDPHILYELSDEEVIDRISVRIEL